MDGSMKRLLTFLLLSAAAFAQGGALQGTALKCNSDNVAGGASIYVGTEASTGTPPAPLASVYSDSTLSTPLANPTTADSCGDFPTIYAAQGNYKVYITGTGLTAKTTIMSVPSGSHALLSSSHSDVTAAAVTRGSIIAGIGASPKWTKVTLSGTGSYPILNSSGDIIDSALGASGIGACTNQFWRTGNSDAAPTCETVGTSDVSTGLRTFSWNGTIFDPVAGDSGRIQWKHPKNITITKVSCNVKAATSVVIQLNKRTEGAPDVSGTDVQTATLTCITTGASTTSFASAAVTADTPVALTISSVTGTPDTLRVTIYYTVDAAQ
jgi:hypothetical protein